MAVAQFLIDLIVIRNTNRFLYYLSMSFVTGFHRNIAIALQSSAIVMSCRLSVACL